MSFLGDAWAADVQVDEVERQPFDAGTMAVQGSAGMLAGAGVTVVGLTSLASTGASPEGTILITLVAIPGVAPIAAFPMNDQLGHVVLTVRQGYLDPRHRASGGPFAHQHRFATSNP